MQTKLGARVGDVAGFFYPRTATGRSSLLPAPPWHYSGDLLTVEYRTDPARVAELLPAPLAPAPDDPGAVALIWADWQSCGDDGAELLDPVRAQYQRVLRGRAVQLRRAGLLALRLHLGRLRLRPGPRPAPGLSQEARLDPPDPAAPVRPRGAADRARRRVRRHAGRGRPPAGPGRGHAARGGRGQRVRQRPPDGAPPVDAVDREGRARTRSTSWSPPAAPASRPARPGAATPPWSCSTRPPRNWPGSRSARSSAATTGRSGSPGTAAACSPERGVPAATARMSARPRRRCPLTARHGQAT